MTEMQQQQPPTDEEYGTAWRPQAGDTVSGIVESIKLIDPNGRGAYPCVDIREDDGELVSVHAFHSVLRRELARKAPGLGDRIGITYQGMREGGQNPDGYHAYRVTGGNPRAFDWSQELPPDERQALAAQTAEPPIAPMPVGQVREQRRVEESVVRSASAEQNYGVEPPF